MKKKIYMMLVCLLCAFTCAVTVKASDDYPDYSAWEEKMTETAPYWFEYVHYSEGSTTKRSVDRVFSNSPIYVAYEGQSVYRFYTEDGSSYLRYEAYYNGEWHYFKGQNMQSGNGYSYNSDIGLKFLSGNYDVKDKDGNIVFPAPPEPVPPVKPDVTLGEDWWTVILVRIVPNVPAIVAVIGGMLLLILLWRYLRRSAKSSMV